MDKDITETLTRETYAYRGCEIICIIQKYPPSSYWTAHGKVMIIHKSQVLHLSITAIHDTFTTEDAARQDFLERAMQTLDQRRRP